MSTWRLSSGSHIGSCLPQWMRAAWEKGLREPGFVFLPLEKWLASKRHPILFSIALRILPCRMSGLLSSLSFSGIQAGSTVHGCVFSSYPA